MLHLLQFRKLTFVSLFLHIRITPSERKNRERDRSLAMYCHIQKFCDDYTYLYICSFCFCSSLTYKNAIKYNQTVFSFFKIYHLVLVEDSEIVLTKFITLYIVSCLIIRVFSTKTIYISIEKKSCCHHFCFEFGGDLICLISKRESKVSILY